MDVDVKRNFFGRQLQSFEGHISLEEPANSSDVPPATGIFIRAPGITSVGKNAKVLARLPRWPNSKPGEAATVVAVEQDTMIGLTFHPELTGDPKWHEYFLQKLVKSKGRTSDAGSPSM